jgi:predicted lipoprotein with Yx(FWY)xxD motif
MTRHSKLLLLALAAALTLTGVACGDDSDEDDDSSAETTAGATDGATVDDAGAATVGLEESDFGDILVNGESLTLYKFDDDEATKPEPTCYEGCAEAWPPLLVDGEPSVAEGLDPALVGTVERTDGTTQVTYNDWPLYTFSGDTAAGDTNGQGVGGTWHVVGADGEPIRD